MSVRFVRRAAPIFGIALLVACAEDHGVTPFAPPMFSSVASTANSQFYQQHNLVSDIPGAADFVDPDLVNAWGLVSSATSPWWVSDNGSGKSTLYNGNTGAKIALTVTVPGDPTGNVFNGSTGFVVSQGGKSGPARFMFASEDGTISGWNPAVLPTTAVVAVDSSASGAVYKGLAIASTSSGDRLYTTNFHAGRVEVYDASFHGVTTSGGFTDPAIPAGYAPFGIRNLGGTIYVTYALQDAAAHDDVAGEGHGFVNAFDTDGHLLRRVASRARLNSPWGLAIAPDSFGVFSRDLLVGNFGDGHINAFDLGRARGTGEAQQQGQLHGADGQPLTIDGLWAISFGNGAAAGSRQELFFTAGPNGEQDGLFGKLVTTTQPTP
jgi:uncharacterized protein (TIGR03118 family)